MDGDKVVDSFQKQKFGTWKSRAEDTHSVHKPALKFTFDSTFISILCL